MSSIPSVHLLQWDLAWESANENLAFAGDLIAHGHPSPGDLMVLPEMFSTGFSMNAAAIEASDRARITEGLSAIALRHGVYLVAGLGTQTAEGRRNQAVFISPDGRRFPPYSKRRPFSLAGENKAMLAGTETVIWPWNGFQLAPFICYDLRFPELFREATARGADLLVVIANWPVIRVAHWVQLLVARAIENQAWVVGVNRTGSDPFHPYPGRSMVVDPHGKIVLDAGETAGVSSTAVDRAVATEWRSRFPALADAGF